MASLTDTLRIDAGIGRLASTIGLRARSQARSGSAELAVTRHPAYPGTPADALPIVLVHGLAGTQQHWDPALEGLRAFGEVITLDLPGFGASAMPARWTLDGACDAVVECLDAAGVDRCVLVGHSLGASVATILATRAPHRVSALGLVSPAGFWSRRRDRAESRRFAVAFEVWRRGVLLGAGHVVKAPPVRLFAFIAMVHRPLGSLTRREAERLVHGAAQGRSTVAAREAVVDADLFDVAAEIEQPVELVWGRRDRITPFDTAERVSAAIPDVRATFLDGVGHMVMFEDRDVVGDIVESLLLRMRDADDD